MFRIFDKLGGEENALDVLALAEGKRPTRYVRADWRKQRRIPPIRAVVLLDECWRRGIKANFAEDCVAPPEEQSEAAE